MENSPGVKPEIMVTVTFECPGFPDDPASAHNIEGLHTIGGPKNLKPPASEWCEVHQMNAPRVAVHNLTREIENIEELEQLQDEIRKAAGFSDN